ncbi:hypothetical protein [Salinibacter altiplanensis]|uniref:hypothetical protein n=1 Tax=Salinibacter altiplanensis TaxID=1803181 RepID=UPI001319C8D3|nr:hypothetical protein [Salinibacter altiplanensis]
MTSRTGRLAVIGCDPTGPATSNDGHVDVGFATAAPSTSTTNSALLSKAERDSLVLSGSNGTLRIHDLRLTVDDANGLQALQNAIQDAGFSNWPGSASMVAQGTFTPEGDTARSFTTYFEAEIEVELEMEDHPFQIGADALTGQLVELEAGHEFVDGASEIEFDDE